MAIMSVDFALQALFFFGFMVCIIYSIMMIVILALEGFDGDLFAYLTLSIPASIACWYFLTKVRFWWSFWGIFI